MMWFENLCWTENLYSSAVFFVELGYFLFQERNFH